MREVGVHPDDEKPIGVYAGRYGPYVKHGKINATIPKDRDPADLTLEEAIALIAERAAKSGKKPAAKKAAAKKPAAKKAAAKKPAKKAAAKKKPAAGKAKKPAAGAKAADTPASSD